MKNYLIVANTYYQLIVALQLRYTLFKDDRVFLLLSDHSNGSEKVAEKIIERGYFTKTKYIKTNVLKQKKTLREKLLNTYENVYVSHNRYKDYLNGICDDYNIDEIITYNIDILTYNLFAILYEKNKQLIVSGYEEGILSYNTQRFEFKGSKTICRLRRMIGKKGIDTSYNSFYCFYPELYKGNLKSRKIPMIDNQGPLRDALQTIFEINPQNINYSQRYIYFTSVYDFEGGEAIGEFDLVQRIAEKVGRENLLVKVHPRDSRNVFSQTGVAIDSNSVIPWEAIQLSGDFANKIYLTATSGSVLAGSFLSPLPIKTYYLFKLCNISNNNVAKRSVHSIEKLISGKEMELQFANIIIANNIDEI